jgi:hypothetical protein
VGDLLVMAGVTEGKQGAAAVDLSALGSEELRSRYREAGIEKLRVFVQTTSRGERLFVYIASEGDETLTLARVTEILEPFSLRGAGEITELYAWHNEDVPAVDATHEVGYAVAVSAEQIENLRSVLSALSVAEYGEVLRAVGFRRIATWLQSTNEATFITVYARSTREYPVAVADVVGGEFPLGLWMRSQASALLDLEDLQRAAGDPSSSLIFSWDA